MNQKYILKKKDSQLIIQELAETEPGKYALLYEEKLAFDRLEPAIADGRRALIDLFRSHNFYPPQFFAEMLAAKIAEIFGNDPKDSATIEFTDADALVNRGNLPTDILVDEKELAEIDKLLEDEDEISDDFDD
ncbi:hypothetical protein JCM14469_00480 [Desulfatiferula olefinivorans]